MITLDRFSSNIGLHNLTFSELKHLNITKEVANTLNIKTNGANEHIIFPFFSGSNSISGCYEMNSAFSNKGQYRRLAHSAHHYIYPFCVPTFKTEKLDQSVLYIVDSPLDVAQYASQNKLSVAICYKNKVSEQLTSLIDRLKSKNPSLTVVVKTVNLDRNKI